MKFGRGGQEMHRLQAFDEKPLSQQHLEHPEDERITLRWISEKDEVDRTGSE
jgi:hypothetical protein